MKPCKLQLKLTNKINETFAAEMWEIIYLRALYLIKSDITESILNQIRRNLKIYMD